VALKEDKEVVDVNPRLEIIPGADHTLTEARGAGIGLPRWRRILRAARGVPVEQGGEGSDRRASKMARSERFAPKT
jgi:hypothetical protein